MSIVLPSVAAFDAVRALLVPAVDLRVAVLVKSPLSGKLFAPVDLAKVQNILRRVRN